MTIGRAVRSRARRILRPPTCRSRMRTPPPNRILQSYPPHEVAADAHAPSADHHTRQAASRTMADTSLPAQTADVSPTSYPQPSTPHFDKTNGTAAPRPAPQPDAH